MTFNNGFNTNLLNFNWNSMNNGMNNFNWSNAMGNGFTVPMAPGGGMDFSHFWDGYGALGGASSTSSSSSSSSGSGSKKELTLAEKLKFQEEHKAEIAEADKIVKEQEELVKKAKQAVKDGNVAEDGTLQVKESKENFAKIPWYKKLFRGSMKTLWGATMGMCDLIGIEVGPPPKIHWDKLGKAALFAGLTAAATCIPVVGPFVVPALLTAGVAMGAGKIATGAYTAFTTDDPEKFDNACEGLGEGIAITGLSLAGIRKAGGISGKFDITNPLAGFKTMWSNAKAESSAFNLTASKTRINTEFISPVKNLPQTAVNKYNNYCGSDGLLKSTWNKIKLPPSWKNIYQYPVKAIKGFFKVSMLPWEWSKSLVRTGYGTGYVAERVFAPKYEAGMLGGLLGMVGCNENNWYGGATPMTIQTQQTDPSSGQAIPVEAPITKDNIQELEQQLAQAKKIKEDLNNGIMPTTQAAVQQTAEQLAKAEEQGKKEIGVA